MPSERGSKYLGDILDGAKPDICFLPGDDKSLKCSGIIRGYDQYLTSNGDSAALLFNASKVQMKSPDVNLSAFGNLAGLDVDQLVCPRVEIRAPAPISNIVKEFNLITWKYTLYTEAKVQVETLSESLILLAQRLAWQTGKGVLIGGEMTIDFSSLQKLINKLCKEGDEMFLSSIQPEMGQLGYLPSMTKASLRDQRHLFMMKVFRCSSNTGNGIVNTWNGQVADCFIASKTLELTEASLMNVEQVIGRGIKMSCPLKQHAPTKTEMVIPPRPPRHHGG